MASLSDEAILFRPTATPGKAWFQNNPAPTSQLSWEPAFADISAAGDFGYTTGPWEIRRSPKDAPAGFGHYVTVWRKQRDGAWKITIDCGVSHAAVPKPKSVESPPIAGAAARVLSEKEIESGRKEVRDVERRFPSTAATYMSALARDARVYRSESLPLVNPNAIRAALAQNTGTFAWKLADVFIAGSADLAATYGTVTLQSKEYSYLRIWKRQRDRTWRVVLDLWS